MGCCRIRKSCCQMFFATKKGIIKDGGTPVGVGAPCLLHALVVIFLEFFAWGLLTVPIINVLAATFPTNKFLMNGLILGIKGFLSFLSAPLIGALSDIWGRKFFLLVTVFCTLMPIPLLKVSPWWYFALFTISGVFSVTFSIVLAYVADITEKDERSSACGMVSATFGASLVISPALGAYVSQTISDEAVVAIATAVSVLDLFFIMVAVPESLPTKHRQSLHTVTWESTDPFASLRMFGHDPLIISLCAVVFLSYLPEAGQFSCIFVYLKLVVGFSPEAVAGFIGVVGILSVIAQTIVLLLLQRALGQMKTIMFGLFCQSLQLLWYALASQYWMMWAAGLLAALSQISYPAISAFVSIITDKDKQGAVQGMVTGIRGLCQGLGPAVFGFIFYLADVDLNVQDESIRVAVPKKLQKEPPFSAHVAPPSGSSSDWSTWLNMTAAHLAQDTPKALNDRVIPGPPFLVGAVFALASMFVLNRLSITFRNGTSRTHHYNPLKPQPSSPHLEHPGLHQFPDIGANDPSQARLLGDPEVATDSGSEVSENLTIRSSPSVGGGSSSPHRDVIVMASNSSVEEYSLPSNKSFGSLADFFSRFFLNSSHKS